MTKSTTAGFLDRMGNHAYGMGFLAVVALMLGLSVAQFQQRFTHVVMVNLLTDRIGSQLQKASDVKIRGLIVGEVRTITPTADGARLELALQPDKVALIPANVSARLLPKTLFGERFVDLVTPEGAPGRAIKAGATIGQDRTKVAIELERVFDDLLPLLRAVQPEKLAATLNALATTLDGRGTELGKNLVLAEKYFTQINPKMPQIKADISGLADLASTYAVAAPDLLRAAKSLLTTNKTIVEKQQELAGFLAGTAGFANTATTFLTANEQRIIQVGRVQRPTLALLEKYSPIYPCFAQGLVNWLPRANGIWAGSQFHITLEISPQRPGYHPGEEPVWGEKRGPNCLALPNPAGSQSNPYGGMHFADGTSGSSSGAASALPQAFSLPGAVGIGSPDSGLAGTVEEQRLVAALLSPNGTGQPSALATLLAGPLLRGNVVSNE